MYLLTNIYVIRIFIVVSQRDDSRHRSAPPGMQLAQARLHDYMCQHTVSEGNDMPAKDYRTFGEDLVNVAVRVPQSVLDQVDTHIATLRTMSPWARVGRSEALRDVILRGIASLASQAPPAPVPIAPDMPPVPHDQPPLPRAPEYGRAPLVRQPDNEPSGREAAPAETADTPGTDTPVARRRARVLAVVPW